MDNTRNNTGDSQAGKTLKVGQIYRNLKSNRAVIITKVDGQLFRYKWYTPGYDQEMERRWTNQSVLAARGYILDEVQEVKDIMAQYEV